MRKHSFEMMGSCPWRSSRPFFPTGRSMRRNSRISSTPSTQTTQNYFANHMGDYEDVLASLETLNLSILKAMDYTKRVYESGSNMDQFVTRFLLKETANQTQSLLSSVESAVDAIDEQTNPCRSAIAPSPPPMLLSWSHYEGLLRGSRPCKRKWWRSCLSHLPQELSGLSSEQSQPWDLAHDGPMTWPSPSHPIPTLSPITSYSSPSLFPILRGEPEEGGGDCLKIHLNQGNTKGYLQDCPNSPSWDTMGC
uniref:Uncharacterized protein n=1 Tax=Meleagris gallopavo TaxID=9103 RepID=A0A803YQE7_MELGA